jgi:hypothetical protein
MMQKFVFLFARKATSVKREDRMDIHPQGNAIINYHVALFFTLFDGI